MEKQALENNKKRTHSSRLPSPQKYINFTLFINIIYVNLNRFQVWEEKRHTASTVIAKHKKNFKILIKKSFVIRKRKKVINLIKKWSHH